MSAAATFSDAAITKSIRNNVQKYYGDFGSGSINVGFRIKYCNEKTKVTIIRCRHGPHRFITSILPLMTVVCILFLKHLKYISKKMNFVFQIGEHRAKFRILYIGATIMQCNKFIVNFQKDCLDRAIGDIESAKDRIDFIKNIMDFKME